MIYGSCCCIFFDNNNQIYTMLTVVNTISRQSTIVYPSYLFSNIIKYATNNENLNINFLNSHLSMTN